MVAGGDRLQDPSAYSGNRERPENQTMRLLGASSFRANDCGVVYTTFELMSWSSFPGPL